MGQKVNPHGIRVGVIKDWDSRWFASKKDFSDNLVEDHKIRTELKAQLKDAGVPKIEIERTVDPSTSAPRVTVNIYCAKPGMVIGKGGEERVALQNKLTKEYGKTVIVNVIEVKSAATNAQLVAEDIARQLENRVTFRRAMKQCMRNAMSPRDRSTVPAKGIKAMCSGRLGGADIARTESYHEGTIPLQTLRADIDYGFAEAATTYGRIGVKVWIYKGEVLKSAKNAQKKEGAETVSGSKAEQKGKGCGDYFSTEIYRESKRCSQNDCGTKPWDFCYSCYLWINLCIDCSKFYQLQCIPAGSFVCHYFHQLFQYR